MPEEKNIITLDFGNQNIPLPIESINTSDTTFVNWGLNNQYPAFLVDLYTQSAIHSAIVNQKTNYIIGNGLKINGDTDIDIQINPSDSFNEFTSKVTKDYILFNAFAVEVILNVFGKPIEFHHVPVHKIRMNRSKTKFWFCENWLQSRKYIKYDRYSTKITNDSTSKIYFFDGYFPSIYNVYPSPEYNGTIKAIRTDIAIKEFNLNNIRNHFSPSTIITFFNGSNVGEEVKKQIIDEIDTKFKGESGKKFIIDFQHKDGKSAEVKQLSANDWDKAYLNVAENNVSDILIGHQVQNPELFAIQTPGKLGNTQSLEVSYEIFKSNYIQVKRDELEAAFNQMFVNYDGIKGKVKYSDKPLFNTQLKDEIKVMIYTINEMREIAGLPPLPDGDKIVSAPTPAAPTQPVQPPVTVTQVQQPTVEEVKKKSNSRSLTEQDYDLIKHLGSRYEDFDIIEKVEHHHHKFDKESDIAQYLIDNDIKGVTLDQLANLLNSEDHISTTPAELDKILKKLDGAGVLKVSTDTNGSITVTPNTMPDVPNTDNVKVMYQYQKRPDVTGDDLLPTSRSFCVKLIENNRLYTREEIQTMSSIFGYDIYQYTGGWYFNPETEQTTSHCRHMWQPLKVKPRN